jgi:hypothetical protein
VSTINADTADQTIANLAVVPVSEHGLTVRSVGGTHVVVDVTGWFTGPPAPVTEPTPPSNEPPALPGCLAAGRNAVADKAAQRYWLCEDGVAITEPLPMTTGGVAYRSRPPRRVGGLLPRPAR